MPYGGLKDSGMGKEGPKYAVQRNDRGKNGRAPFAVTRRRATNAKTLRKWTRFLLKPAWFLLS